jgi:hypothetical protein
LEVVVDGARLPPLPLLLLHGRALLRPLLQQITAMTQQRQRQWARTP